MTEPHDPNHTVDVPSAPDGDEPADVVHTEEHFPAPAGSLDAALAAAFAAPP
jgi:hypothetical protein